MSDFPQHFTIQLPDGRKEGRMGGREGGREGGRKEGRGEGRKEGEKKGKEKERKTLQILKYPKGYDTWITWTY